MTTPDPHLTEADLEELYAPPSEYIQKAVTPDLNAFHVDYLAKATFFCLATGGVNGAAKVGQRGGVKAGQSRRVR